MKWWLQMVLWVGWAVVWAEEPTRGEAHERVVPAAGVAAAAASESKDEAVPWLGLRVAKVVPELRTQVPDLPAGVGFSVDSVEPVGPAATAGLRKHDVIWKMDGQLLVNEAQLGVLLALRKPGQVVEVDFFRAGKAEKVQLTLGKAPPDFVMSAGQVGERVVISPPTRTMPVRIVDVPSRTATMENTDGRAVLVRGERGYELTITGPTGETLWEGVVPRSGIPGDVPAAWRERTVSLREALEQASPRPRLSPRLRIVPPPAPRATDP